MWAGMWRLWSGGSGSYLRSHSKQALDRNMPARETEPHFARRQHTAAQLLTPLTPRDKFASCPKCIILLGIFFFPIYSQCLLSDVSQAIHISPLSLTHTHKIFYPKKMTLILLASPYRTVEVTTRTTSSQRFCDFFSCDEGLHLSLLLPRTLSKPFFFKAQELCFSLGISVEKNEA